MGLILEESGKTLQQFGVSERLHELLCDLGNSLLEKHLRLINDARRAIKGMVVQNAPNRPLAPAFLLSCPFVWFISLFCGHCLGLEAMIPLYVMIMSW